MSLSGSKGSSKTKSQEQSSTTNTLDPQLNAALFGNLQRAQQIANAPFTPYSGQRVAGFTAGNIAGQQGLMNVAGSNVGGEALGSAKSAALGASAYRPQTVMAQGYSPTKVQTSAINRGDIQNLSSGPITADQIGQYFNPYQQSVIDTTNADLERQRQIQQSVNAAGALKAHAFGGTGAAVASDLTNQDFNRQIAGSTANLRSQGYNAALAAAQQDAARGLQAGTANQGVDLSVANANASFGQQANMFNAGVSNDAARYGADQTYQAAAANQQAGLGAAGLNLQGATALGQLAGQERSQAIENANLYNQVGEAQRQANQAQFDAAYDEYLRAQNNPIMMQQLLNQTLGLVPNFGSTASQGSGSVGQKSTSFGFG